ncbi:FMN-binding protein [Amycolatopsis granulosa]|uniref:FMN-binding protein n=1 Tax=Amycolatopsis granulosa TaxID=185684 RepID=UPI001422E1C6|nr:FMN-binding protein [Amycolatopsis granulosa]NIH84408.1 uncharacterized protein with FMN-binding domain [Amycolatopsis granulosa]
MKGISLWVLSTITVLVLLFGYHTSTSSSMASGPGVVATPVPTPAPGTGTPAAGGSTVTGPVAPTRWGPVQVQLTVQNGKISNVQVVQYPNGNSRDREINDYALPVLVQDTLNAQSADIDMVSGATVTSEGYLQSLQGALDKAGR